MKLVDILARELKVWPEGCGFVGQASDETLHMNNCKNYSDSPRWTDEKYTKAEDWARSLVSRAEWQAAVDALNAPKVVEWDGVGLPPVGSEIEAGFACEEFSAWHKGICIAIGEDPEGRDDICIVQFGKKIAAYTAHSGRIRPIRTAEQVAAEEREKAIKEMMMHGVDAGDSTIEYSCAALYDAGYRKEANPCGS